MHRKILSLFLVGFVSISILNWGCTKLDTTTLGSDLIPAVDNVNTFADTIPVVATQAIYNDTTYVASISDHVVGSISSDPLFGKTTANIFMQLKPALYPFSFGDKDSLNGLGIDSVVLCLNYKGFWGDSNAIQTLQAFRVEDDSFEYASNKVWRTDEQPLTGIAISDPVNVDIKTLDDYLKFNNGKDSVNNQIRIKLSESYMKALFGTDTATSGIFKNDSIYKRVFPGIAVKSAFPCSALMYVNLADTNTKLEVHYRIRKLGGIDTTYQSFTLETEAISTESIKNSKTANYINRDRSGTPSETPPPGELYLQAQPGTYASLVFPRLNGYKDSNKIIHRAELIIEQIPTDPLLDFVYVAPNYLYLDLKDTVTTTPAATRYKPVYLDLNPASFYDPDNKVAYFFPTADGPDFSYYGGFARKKLGPQGNEIVYYNINVTRYIQQLVTKHGTNYDMRLFPAYSIHYLQYATYIPYNNSVAFGRVKVGDGSNPTYPMRLRIIYSNVK